VGLGVSLDAVQPLARLLGSWYEKDPDGLTEKKLRFIKVVSIYET
jgi:hypothetical protein